MARTSDQVGDPLELCRLEQLPRGGSKGVSVTIDMEVRDLFLVRQEDEVFCYVNSCPHTGGPLDWVPDQFLNLDADHIQCATHDALFRIDDGLCVAGPCAGKRLSGVPVVVRGGVVYLGE